MIHHTLKKLEHSKSKILPRDGEKNLESLNTPTLRDSELDHKADHESLFPYR
jgi:hypothetical protein